MPFPPEDRSAYIDVSGSDNIVFDACNISDTTGIYNAYGDDGFRLYPNTNDGSFTIELARNDNAEMVIMDMNGKIIYLKEITDGTEQVDISKYPNGIYFIRVTQRGITYHQKLVLK